MIARVQNFLHRFKSNEEGIASVEFAVVSPVLVGLFLASLELGATSAVNNNMTSSLRFSAQYIANGGEDIGVAQNVFARSFGDYESFSTLLSCSCATARASLDPEEGEGVDPVTEILGPITASVSDAPMCTTDCGQDPVIRYLKLSASATFNPIIGSEQNRITKSVSVRLKQ